MHSNNEKTHETQGKYTQLAKKYTKRTSAQTQTKKTNKNKHMVASNDNKQLTVMCQQIIQIIRSNNEKTHEIQGKNRYNLHKMHDNQTSAKSQTKNNKKKQTNGFF